MKLTYTYTNAEIKITQNKHTEPYDTFEHYVEYFHTLVSLGWQIRKAGNKVYCTLKDANGKTQYILTK